MFLKVEIFFLKLKKVEKKLKKKVEKKLKKVFEKVKKNFFKLYKKNKKIMSHLRHRTLKKN